MRWVGDQRHMHIDAVKFPVGAGAEMVFHIARPRHIIGVVRPAAKFVEDHAVGLGHHIGEHVQPAAMRHAIDDFADAELPAIFDHALQRGDHAFAAIEPEALGADIFTAEEFLPLFGLDQLVEDRLLAHRREFNRLVLAFHSILQETAFLDIGDVHIFKADRPAVILLQGRNDFAHRGPLPAKRAAQINQLIKIAPGEPMIFRGQISGQFLLGDAERIKLSSEMTAHPIGADQHHRADRISRGGGHIDGGCWRWGSDLGRGTLGGLWRCFHLRWVERGGQIIGCRGRPGRLRPAGAGSGALQPFEKAAPARLDTIWRHLVPRIKRLDKGWAHRACERFEILAFIAHYDRPSLPFPFRERVAQTWQLAA